MKVLSDYAWHFNYMMDKTYSVDNNNRLVIKRKEEELIPEGSFLADEANQLIYRLNEPDAWRTKYNLPKEIAFIGAWKINSNYDLELQLEQKKPASGKDVLTLKGEIISSEKDKLVFEMETTKKDGLSSFSLLKLYGRWQAGEFNQISFL